MDIREVHVAVCREHASGVDRNLDANQMRHPNPRVRIVQEVLTYEFGSAVELHRRFAPARASHVVAGCEERPQEAPTEEAAITRQQDIHRRFDWVRENNGGGTSRVCDGRVPHDDGDK
jgi:hypothetical protein